MQPLPAQITITPGNSANLDPVARPQNASGQTTTFAVQYFASTSGIDQKVKFTCTGTNGISGTVCPGSKTLTSNAAATTIPVTFNTESPRNSRRPLYLRASSAEAEGTAMGERMVEGGELDRRPFGTWMLHRFGGPC